MKSFQFLIIYFLKKPKDFFFYLSVLHNPLYEIFAYFAEFTGRVSHIKIARWADVILVAPATCNSIGKICAGITDNFALLVIRALQKGKRVVVAPSMNPEMWEDPFNKLNISAITRSDKYILVNTIVGTATSGDKGAGIMPPNDIVIGKLYEQIHN